MSDQPQHGGNGGFEREDLGAKTIFGFLIGLAVLLVLVYFVVTGMYRTLNGYYETHQPPVSPLKPATEINPRDTKTPEVKKEVERTFPQPLLETDERNELNDFRMQEAGQLDSYGWVDQKAGVVHIPIERAMQLVAQRGLPVVPGETSSGSPAKMAPSGKKTAANKAAKQ
jgi:hypothetical protein